LVLGGPIFQLFRRPHLAGDISRLAAATAAPLVPLLLAIFSPEERIVRIIKVVFANFVGGRE